MSFCLLADDTHVCALSSSGVHDGHAATHPPQTMERVCIHVFDREKVDSSHLTCSNSFISNKFCYWSLPVSSVVATAPDILSPLSLILESVLQADQQMMERTKAKIFSALISVLQIQGLNGERGVCKCLLFSAFELNVAVVCSSIFFLTNVFVFVRWRYFPAAPAVAVRV